MTIQYLNEMIVTAVVPNLVANDIVSINKYGWVA